MWSRDYSESNTRLLRELLDSGRIRVDIEAGTVEGYSEREINFWGYERFRVCVKGKRYWFFTHKAVMMASGIVLDKPGYEINHKDRNRTNNRIDNLEYITWESNLAYRYAEPEVEPAF